MERPTLEIENELKAEGYKYIIGIDEAGRGALIGSVVAAAVMIPEGFDFTEIRDSKKLSAKKREILYNKIISGCDYFVSSVDEKIIDSINILNATKLAMRHCIYEMRKADFALIDGNFAISNVDIDQKSVVGGDNISASIASASIIAKVTRDNMMRKLHEEIPIYALNKNMGYGTKYHREAIKIYGPTIYHRQTFGGVKEYRWAD